MINWCGRDLCFYIFSPKTQIPVAPVGKLIFSNRILSSVHQYRFIIKPLFNFITATALQHHHLGYCLIPMKDCSWMDLKNIWFAFISRLIDKMEYDIYHVFHDQSQSPLKSVGAFRLIWLGANYPADSPISSFYTFPVVSTLVPLSRAWLSSVKSDLLFWIYVPFRLLWVKSVLEKSLNWFFYVFLLWTVRKTVHPSHCRRKIPSLPSKQSCHIKENRVRAMAQGKLFFTVLIWTLLTYSNFNLCPSACET